MHRSGKTITALSAIEKHSADGFPTIIIGPSKLLIDQWEEEISEKLPAHELLIVDGRSENKSGPDTLVILYKKQSPNSYWHH